MNDLVEVGDNSPTTNNFEMVDVQGAKAFMDNYQEVCKSLLDKSDYQNIKVNGKSRPFKKKSAWRKIATAFNISDDIVEKEIIRDDNYQIISANFVVRATAPNGRYGHGTGSCSIFDKINNKDTEQPSNFELRKRFSNAENDVIGTAHTRAKSRAISDLVGMGEVSAEEMMEMGVIDKPKKVSVKPKTAAKPKPKGDRQKLVKELKRKAKEVKPSKDEEAVEVEVIAHDSPSKSLKDMMDENKTIKRVIEELREENRIVNRATIEDRLLNQLQSGAITEKEYKKAKEVME
ncbi:MAG: hypothetical protein IJF83_10815 [Methanobrevibacter sp.]|nr:hypothetical protein [Methanobrevibacter sp.]